MKLLRTVSKLKIVGLIAIVPILIAGTVVAYNITTPSKTTNNATQTEQITTPKKIDKQSNDSEQVETTPEEKTASESTNASTQPTTQTPKITTTQPTQTATDTTPQQTTTPTPTPPTCNESMKSSYTSLYNSQVNAENASWANQITAWNNYASGTGNSFSGYTQSMINDNKPAHDARLAQLQTQYYQNLVSINCNL